MQRSCPHCKESFSIPDDTRGFLEKISPAIAGRRFDIPIPTLCPSCGCQRRLAHRNERKLYKRRCDKTGADIVSIYHPDTPFPVYDVRAWWGDGWDAKDFRRNFDFSRPFFEQFRDLQNAVPRMSVLQLQNENSLFTNCVSNLKDCYLLFSSDFDRNCYYGTWNQKSTDCMNNYLINQCERTANSIFSDMLYNCHSVIYSQNCRDSAYLFDCRSCNDCILCWNLRNKQYCIENEQLTKEEFLKRRGEMLNGTHSEEEKLEKRFAELMRTKAIHLSLWRKGRILDSSGDWLTDTENCRDCYQVVTAKDCRYVLSGYEIKDAYDCNYVNGELGYEQCECFPMPYHSAFTLNSYTGADLYYCDLCMSDCKDCFGCVGLKKAQYCVFNKQYTKEEYEALVPKIIDHMRSDGVTLAPNPSARGASGSWGEFFPMEHSVFGYNETNAQDYWPITKENAKERGWPWTEENDDVGTVTKTIPASRLPDAIRDIPDEILQWAIECEATGRPFRIIEQELRLLRDLHLPIPRLHPDERHRRRIAVQNPRTLWERPCANCKKTMQTTYAPEKSERVFCEECYLKSVY